MLLCLMLNETQGYGFAEVKCPYKHKDVSPKEACSDQTFCCELIKVGGSDQVKLKENHPYYSQVQGQMLLCLMLHETQGYGFAEVKCPYKHKDVSPKEACSDQTFCCELIKVGGSDQVKLKENHPYYSQVQGQMAIGGRVWNDFIIYTNRGISIERIHFNKDFWDSTLLPILYLCHFMITVWHQRYCIPCIQSVILYEIYPISNLYNILQFACALFVYKVLYNYITFSVLTLYLVRKTNVTNTIITYMSR